MPTDSTPPSSARTPESTPPPSFVAPKYVEPRWSPWKIFLNFLEQLGHVGKISWGSVVALFKPPFEGAEIMHQMESIGVASAAIASVTAVFTGMVMAVQFAIGLQKFGGMEYTGRIIGLSFSRELAPTLTAVIVGGRIGSGIAAEVGSMAVYEQIDAIRALGADPIKKLVMPRLVASTIVMPILGAFSLVLGFAGAMFITSLEFDIPAGFFLRTALGSVTFSDYFSGMFKTPFFGAIIAIIGCHFGMITRGGSEGVGNATTRTVVATSIAILVSDFFLTKLSVLLFPTR